MEDLVSVIIPTYKRADMLSRAIDSVLQQTYKNIEVIVVDDNNPGTEYRRNTEKIMQQYKEVPKVIYIKHEKNKNGAAARNTGILHCNGEYICFLDDDDWYMPDKVKKQVEYLVNNNDYDAVYCGWNRKNKNDIPYEEGDLSFELLSGISLIYTNTIMIKKSVALKIGGWDERFRRNQEAVFLLKYFHNGYKIGVVSEVLVNFDVSDRSNASNPKENEKDFEQFLRLHEVNIEKCKATNKHAKSIIYSYRFRGVLLNYLKNKDYIGAIKIYLKMTGKMPVRFNRDVITYFFNKCNCYKNIR